MSLPIPQCPANPVAWIFAAIDQKLAKLYSEASPTILIVDFHNRMPLYGWELAKLAAQLADRSCPFREVWVCPEMSPHIAQLLPPAAFAT